MDPFDHEQRSSTVAPAWARLLAEVESALDERGVRYCVLRETDADAGAARRREVDLLVDPRDLQQFERAVLEAGFAPLPSLGHGGHRFYVCYEETAGEWLKLDVVTSLRYGGPTRPFSSRAFGGSLGRRRRADETWLPDHVDAVLGLILHGVLDKGVFREGRRGELQRLRAVIETDTSLRRIAAERFDAVLGSVLSWVEASAAIRDGEWDKLLERRRRITWALFRSAPLDSAVHRLEGEMARLLRPLLVATIRRGFSVALLGPDGAGKTSLARALAEDAQIRARIAYMGSNVSASTVGLPTTRWIERWNEKGRSSGLIGGGLMAVGYVNRLIEQGYRSLVAIAWKCRGRFVVFDRHPYELLIAGPAQGAGSRLRRRLLLATGAQPDLVLVLDAPPELLQSRKNEHSVEWLERQRKRYRSLSANATKCVVLDASDDQETIVRRAKFTIWDRYRQHVVEKA